MSKCETCGHDDGKMIRPEIFASPHESGDLEFNEGATVTCVDGVECECNTIEEAAVLYREQIEIFRGRRSLKDWLKENS